MANLLYDRIKTPTGDPLDLPSGARAPAVIVRRPWQDAEYFGARPIEVAPNHNSTQALNDAAESGVGMLLGPGTYISGPVGIQTRFRMQGMGQGVTRIRLEFPGGIAPPGSARRSAIYTANYDNGGRIAGVHLSGLTVDANRQAHNFSGISGDGGGHVIDLRGVSDFSVTDVEILNGYTDGIYLARPNGSNGDVPEYGQLRGLRIRGCQRQGISVIAARHLLISDLLVSDIVGTSPMGAIDLEPNPTGGADVVEDVEVVNLLARNCGQGLLIASPQVGWIQRVRARGIKSVGTTTHHALHINRARDVVVSDLYGSHTPDGASQMLAIVENSEDVRGRDWELYDSRGVGARITAVDGLDVRGLRVVRARHRGLEVQAGVTGALRGVEIIDANASAGTFQAMQLMSPVTLRDVRVRGTQHDRAIRLDTPGVRLIDADLTSGKASSAIQTNGHAYTVRRSLVDGAVWDDHDSGMPGQGRVRMEQATIPSGGAYTFGSRHTLNRGTYTLASDGTGDQHGRFSANSTSRPTDLGSGVGVEYATASGGAVTDGKLRVYPASGSTLAVQNNTSATRIVTLYSITVA